MRDSWRLAAGTLLALKVQPPSVVNGSVAGRAMLLAPLTAIPGGLTWALLGVGALHFSVPPMLAAAVAVALPALLSRAMHLDGLADTADGLTSGYDRERSLEVMRRGDTGPAGAAAIVVTLLIQFACLTTLFGSAQGTVAAVFALIASRLAPAVSCRRGVPPARSGGLGSTVSGTVAPIALVTTLLIVVALSAAVAWPWPRPYAAVAAVLAAATAAGITVRQVRSRLGGITGDTIGAAIEIALATGLTAAALAVTITTP